MSSSSKMILLESKDGETFELEESVALQSKTIEHMIEDGCADSVIPTPNITGKILSKVIEYCNKHAETSKKGANKVTAEDLKEFDAEFVKVDQGTLFAIIHVRFVFFVVNCVIFFFSHYVFRDCLPLHHAIFITITYCINCL